KSEMKLNSRTLTPLIIIAAGLCAYLNSLRGPFIFDDIDAINENPHIRKLWPLAEVLSAPRQTPVAGRPVVGLSLAINYALGGLNVCGYHVFNLATHMLAGLTLFGIVRRTLQRHPLEDQPSGSPTWFALAVALTWMLHPLQTEAVTYVIQRAESLMGLFYL